MDRGTQLAVLVLEWAKVHHPNKYQQTIEVAGRSDTLMKYMLRLLELRWSEDKSIEFRREVPLWALEMSSIRQRVRIFGREIELCGMKVKPRVWGFDEVVMLGNVEKPIEWFGLLCKAKETLDLERI